jgi:exodeoxyribonuclease-3
LSSGQRRAGRLSVSAKRQSTPRPQFDYKLKWIAAFEALATELLLFDEPVVLAGDYNIIPTDKDVYKPERWTKDALFAAEVRDAFNRLTTGGWTDACATCIPGEQVFTFWDYFRNAYARDAGLRMITSC